MDNLPVSIFATMFLSGVAATPAFTAGAVGGMTGGVVGGARAGGAVNATAGHGAALPGMGRKAPAQCSNRPAQLIHPCAVGAGIGGAGINGPNRQLSSSGPQMGARDQELARQIQRENVRLGEVGNVAHANPYSGAVDGNSINAPGTPELATSGSASAAGTGSRLSVQDQAIVRQIQQEITRLGEIGNGAHENQQLGAKVGGKTNGGASISPTGSPTMTGSATSRPALTEPNQNSVTIEAASHLAKTDAVSPNSLRTTLAPSNPNQLAGTRPSPNPPPIPNSNGVAGAC